MFLSDANRKKLQNNLRESGFLWTASLVLDRLGFRVFRLWPEKTMAPEILAGQITAILRAWGMAEEHIAITVEHIMYADVHGIDSHGCSMLLHYHRQLQAHSVTMTPKIEIVRESETTALVDGGGGLGHVPADVAMKLAIAKCRNTGVGAVTVRNSGHYGAAGSYGAMAARSDLIGLAMTNVRQPALVPTHGLSALLGTNPIAFAAPAARNKPFLLDMATSIVPMGKVFMAWRKGRSIPAGWALDHRGAPLRNPGKAMDQRRVAPLGGTLKMGGHKGYGLATMVEILSSVLSGNSRTTSGVGHFFLALNPERFGETADFKTQLDSLMDALRSTEPKTPGQPVRVAGDPEYEAAADRRRNGIPLTRCVIEDIRTVCRASGVPFLL